MMRRKKTLMALVLVLVLGMAAVAAADGAPTLMAGRTRLTYPDSTRLISTVASGTTGALMERLAGESDWTTFALLPAGRTTTWLVRPKSTAAFQVLASDDTSSAIVTVSVAAQLSKPEFKGKGHKGEPITLKGWIAPLHLTGNVQLTFYRWEKTGTTVITIKGKGGRKLRTKIVITFGWVKHGDPVDVALVPHNPNKSRWSYKWTPAEKGYWKVVVSHEDVAHVYSSASRVALIKH
jgi:hypothetical protein